MILTTREPERGATEDALKVLTCCLPNMLHLHMQREASWWQHGHPSSLPQVIRFLVACWDHESVHIVRSKLMYVHRAIQTTSRGYQVALTDPDALHQQMSAQGFGCLFAVSWHHGTAGKGAWKGPREHVCIRMGKLQAFKAPADCVSIASVGSVCG